MRVVFVGKGGSGKSTLAGLLCDELRNRAEHVVAISADTVPGLAQVLGMEASDEWDLAGMAVRDHGGWKLDGTAAEVVDRCARDAGPGIRFLQAGNVDASLKDYEFRRETNLGQWSGTVAFNTVSRQYDNEDGWVVVDLQGGTGQPAGGFAGTRGIVILVVEAFAKSLLTARRMAEMGSWPAGLQLVAVANKVASADDEAYIAAELDRLGVPLMATVPADPAVQSTERNGQPLVTLDASAPVRAAVATLADRLEGKRSQRVVGSASG